MDAPAHIPILRKTGKVLVVVGLLDIAVMLYSIFSGISYSSSLNVFAVIAGVFLLRGSLGAAGLVRWFSVFFLAALCTLVLAWPALQPLGLTLTHIRLNPLAALASGVFLAGILYLFFWLQRQLSAPSVLSAVQAAGKKVRNMLVPAALGVTLVALLATALPVLLGGESAAKAKSIAQQRLGAGYQYHVSSLSISSSSRGTSVSATVTAWNDSEIRTVPVQWSE